jgi:drug/metabolite transporter (DMT)-like permease
VVPVLASFAMGERIGAVPALGIALGIGAIVLVSQQSADPHGEARSAADGRLPRGVGIALISGVAIGFFFLSLAQTRPEAGMWPIVASRTVSVLLFSLLALAGRQSIRMPGTLALTVLCGIVDMSANALYLLAVQAGPLSVMVTLSSLYPASTVLLARVLLGEQLNTRQVTGVVCALAAIVLIVSGGPP